MWCCVKRTISSRAATFNRATASMYRREGRYELALRHFSQAIEEYGKRDPEHRNWPGCSPIWDMSSGLSLCNCANASTPTPLSGGAASRPCAAITRASAPRRSLISTARRRFTSCIPTIAARGRCVNRGHLHLDSGDLHKADDEARMAYKLGEEKKDYILMARARLLECMVENTKLEERSKIPPGWPISPSKPRRKRCGTARRTENRRSNT